MVIVCLDNSSVNKLLTIGRSYPLIKESNYGSYVLIDDNGDRHEFSCHRFKKLDEIREEKISKLLES